MNLKNNNWHTHQNDPDNWIKIPEFNVLPQDVEFQGFAHPIMGPTTNDGWQVRVSVWEIVKIVRNQGKKRFKSLSDLRDVYIGFLDRVVLFDKQFTTETYTDDEVFAFRYESIFYNLERCLQRYKKDKINSIVALAQVGCELAEMLIEKPIDQDSIRKIRTDMATKGAKAKLAIDRKQKDKLLVRECWDEWKKKPDRYNGKAKFARDMLTKYENLESNAVIAGWCLKWERETITQPAK